jgi:bacterial leucyl aminopeptidase
MKFTSSLLAVSVLTAVEALSIGSHGNGFIQQSGTHNGVEEEKYLIELAPGKTAWIVEDEKWELRRVS